MKYTVLFALILSNNLFAQRALNWVNYPTVDGISSVQEERMRNSWLVEGNVQKIVSTSYFAGDNDREVLEIVYSDSGNVSSIQETNYDPDSEGGISSMVKLEFYYVAKTGKLESENIRTEIEGHVVEDIIERWPQYYPVLLQPLKSDDNGKSITITLFGDTTYSFYDEYNRKIMDSIPSFSDDGKKITYRYEGNKIYRDFYYIKESDDLYQKEEYTIDEQGNWTELKYFGMFNLEGEDWTQIYTREITYR